MTRGNVVEILRVAREAGWTTIVGGPEPGAYALEYLQSGADFVVFGEGELTTQELLQALKQRSAGAWKNISGIAWLDSDGHLHQNPPRDPVADLDAQPWPARQAIDINRYVNTWRNAHGTGSVNFITARSCPFKLPLVQSSGLRTNPPPPQPSPRRR